VAEPGITLTGADEVTPIRDLCDLAAKPGVEIGILLSLNPEGRNRYPGVEWIEDAVAALGARAAIHICGRAAREAVLAGRLPWAAQAGRLQLNGLPRLGEVIEATAIVPQVITQHAPGAHGKTDSLHFNVPGHGLLVDASGGRGLAPRSWARPSTGKEVGFAGGLGPMNLAVELPKIAAVATGAWWIDMETHLRIASSDRFSIERAKACVDLFEAWKRDRLEPEGEAVDRG
jgi:hypothetical protein